LATKRKFDLYQKMLHEPDAAKQRVLMREFEKRVVDTEAHEFPMLWWYRIIPYRLYVKGWKISRSHYVNQDSSTAATENIDPRARAHP
jgi:peptide/nickel transport system substrate-binding protein